MFQKKANSNNQKISVEIVAAVKKKIQDEIKKSNSELSYSQLNNVFQAAIQCGLVDVSIYYFI